jgi:ketosteroid isomerase-like protein
MRTMSRLSVAIASSLVTISSCVQSPAGPLTPLSRAERADSDTLTFRPVGRDASQRGASDGSFDVVLAAVETAQVQLVNGQPGPFKALWSHGDDVTLSGGLGGAIARGWPQVSTRLDWVATQYAEGVRTHQEVARHIGQDLAYVVLRETIRFKNPADARTLVQDLRVTQIFRREDGRWRIVHRHADSQMMKTPTP